MSNKPKFTIPTIQQLDQAQQGRKTTLFFKSKKAVSNASGESASGAAAGSASDHNPTPVPVSNDMTKTNQPNDPALLQPQAKDLNITASVPAIPPSPGEQQTSTPMNTAALPIRTIRRTMGNAILVNPSQQKNPLLQLIRNVPWEMDNTVKADYVVGLTTGVLYLSLRYHRLYPGYIYDRMAKLTRMYVLKVLLVNVDIDNYHDSLRELNRSAILNEYTLMLAWSLEEAARYLETYKVFENKPPDLIRERPVDDYYTKMSDCLTNVRSVNKTDALTLLSNFGSLKGISRAPVEQLAMCPGFGEQKVRRLQQAFTQPFYVNQTKKKKQNPS